MLACLTCMYIDVNITSGNILEWDVQNAEVIAHTILNASKSYLLGNKMQTILPITCIVYPNVIPNHSTTGRNNRYTDTPLPLCGCFAAIATLKVFFTAILVQHYLSHNTPIK